MQELLLIHAKYVMGIFGENSTEKNFFLGFYSCIVDDTEKI